MPSEPTAEQLSAADAIDVSRFGDFDYYWRPYGPSPTPDQVQAAAYAHSNTHLIPALVHQRDTARSEITGWKSALETVENQRDTARRERDEVKEGAAKWERCLEVLARLKEAMPKDHEVPPNSDRCIETILNMVDRAKAAEAQRDALQLRLDAAIKAAELYRGWSVPRPVAEYEAIRTKKIEEADALLATARETTT